MKRLAMGLAGAVLFIALLPTQAGAGATPIGPAISFVHTIGTTPDTNFVDVYIRDGGSDGDFSLVIAGDAAGFGYGATFDAGNLPPGQYRVLVCNAADAPLEQIADCSDNEESSANGNTGNNVTVPNTEQVALVLGWNNQGRGAVMPFTIDVSCVEAGQGRATAAHAAYGDPVTVSTGGTPIFTDLAHGDSAAINVPAGSYDVNISNAQAINIDATIVVAALQNTVTYVAGNPVTSKVAYTLVTQTFPLEPCDAAPPSSVTTQAVQAATQPRFTG